VPPQGRSGEALWWRERGYEAAHFRAERFQALRERYPERFVTNCQAQLSDDRDQLVHGGSKRGNGFEHEISIEVVDQEILPSGLAEIKGRRRLRIRHFSAIRKS
jgi:flagellar basal body L-ring protein FlgH